MHRALRQSPSVRGVHRPRQFALAMLVSFPPPIPSNPIPLHNRLPPLPFITAYRHRPSLRLQQFPQPVKVKAARGLTQENRRAGWMRDETRASLAQDKARARAEQIRDQGRA